MMSPEFVKQQDQLVVSIIKEQEIIVGSTAWEVAGQVNGLRIDIKTHNVNVEGNLKQVLELLVARYESVFGPASREVCRDAVRPLLSQVPENEIPAILR